MTLRPLIGVGWLLLLLVPPLALAVREALRPGRSAPLRRRWWLRSAALLAAFGVGLGPSVPTTTDQEMGVAVEIFFVVDRTGSMAAEDWGQGTPRLDGVRNDLPALVAAVPGARYSIIGWDSQATRQLPLTTDGRAVGAWTQTVRQEITAYSSGSLVDRPLAALTSALEGAAERNPSHVRLVFFLSDGEQTTSGEAASFAALAPLVDGGAVLGYGTAEGGPMRSYDGALEPDPDAPYILDGDGPDAPQAISRIDEVALRTVADQLGVPYVLRAGPDDVTPLVAGLDPEEIATDGRREQTLWSAVTWPIALVLVALLASEAWWVAGSWTPVRRGGVRRAERDLRSAGPGRGASDSAATDGGAP